MKRVIRVVVFITLITIVGYVTGCRKCGNNIKVGNQSCDAEPAQSTATGGAATCTNGYSYQVVSFAGSSQLSGTHTAYESFTLATPLTVSVVSTYLRSAIANTTGTISAEIQTDSGGAPSGSAVAASLPMLASTLTGSYLLYDFTLTTPTTINAGNYWLAIKTQATDGQVFIPLATVDTYSGGYYRLDAANNVNVDLNAAIYGCQY
jgi:hypothetical protein